MNGTSKSSKVTASARVQALIAGTQKHFPTSSITLGNATYTAASLVELLKSLADAIAVVDAAHASAKDAVTALRGAQAKVGPVMLAYKRWLITTFGTATQTLADFGVQPHKARTPRTSAQNAAAAAKRRATRQARGTTGKKAKLAIKGDVTGVIVTPVTSASAPSPGAAPAVAAAPAEAPEGRRQCRARQVSGTRGPGCAAFPVVEAARPIFLSLPRRR